MQRRSSQMLSKQSLLLFFYWQNFNIFVSGQQIFQDPCCINLLWICCLFIDNEFLSFLIMIFRESSIAFRISNAPRLNAIPKTNLRSARMSKAQSDRACEVKRRRAGSRHDRSYGVSCFNCANFYEKHACPTLAEGDLRHQIIPSGEGHVHAWTSDL